MLEHWFVKHMLLYIKGEEDANTVSIHGTLTATTTSRQVVWAINEQRNTGVKPDHRPTKLADTYRASHSMAERYTFFSSAYCFQIYLSQ